MHINHVTASALKGKPLSEKLYPKTIIAGPNFAGKTRITEAIRLALLGKLPELGGKPQAAFALSSASKMEIRLELFEGTSPIESITFSAKESRGSVKVEHNSTGDYKCSLLDSEEWFKMSERERIDYVFRNVTMPPDKTPEGIRVTLCSIEFETDDKPVVEKIIGQVGEILCQAEDQAALPDAILSAEQWLTNDFTTYNRRATDSEGAIRMLTELKLREDECSANTIQELRNQLASVREKIGEEREEAGRLKGNKEASALAVTRRAEIKEELQKQFTPKPIPEFVATVDAKVHKAAISEAQAQLNEIPEESVVVIESAMTSAASDKAVADQNTVDAEKAVARAEEQLAKLDALECCPNCGASSEGWKETLRVGYVESVASAKRLLESRVLISEKRKAEVSGLAEKLSAARERQAKRAELLQALQRAGATLQRDKEAQEAHIKRCSEIESDNETAKRKHIERRATLRTQLDSLDTLPAYAESDISVIDARIITLEDKVGNLSGKLAAAEKLANDIHRGEQAAEEFRQADSRRRVIKAVKEKLVEIKGELVTSAFGALLETANRITGGILRSLLAYNEETSEVGMWTENGFVSHRTFSGTEKALAYVAIAAALSSKSALRVLILDELARLTASMQRRVMAALSKALDDGILDQVIVIIPSDVPVSESAYAELGDWKVINLS